MADDVARIIAVAIQSINSIGSTPATTQTYDYADYIIFEYDVNDVKNQSDPKVEQIGMFDINKKQWCWTPPPPDTTTLIDSTYLTSNCSQRLVAPVIVTSAEHTEEELVAVAVVRASDV
jgi:hypothetical protein